MKEPTQSFCWLYNPVSSEDVPVLCRLGSGTRQDTQLV